MYMEKTIASWTNFKDRCNLLHKYFKIFDSLKSVSLSNRQYNKNWRNKQKIRRLFFSILSRMDCLCNILKIMLIYKSLPVTEQRIYGSGFLCPELHKEMSKLPHCTAQMELPRVLRWAQQRAQSPGRGIGGMAWSPQMTNFAWQTCVTLSLLWVNW